MASKRRNVFYQNEKQETTEIEEECREERDWLETAGLSGLTDKAFLEGREVTAQELERAVAVLSREQAAAVRRRVDTVNKTLRQRHRHLRRFRNRKPDIREVFREVESLSSSGDSRSRSATPDSLDSEPPSPPAHHRHPDRHDHGVSTTVVVDGNENCGQTAVTSGCHLVLPVPHRPNNVSRFRPALIQRNESKRRGNNNNNNVVLSHHGLFTRACRSGGDIVASETADGIRMVGYQKIGSMRVRERTKSESDPISLNSIETSLACPKQHNVVCVTRSHDSLFENERYTGGGGRHETLSTPGSSPRSAEALGFEEMWAGGESLTSINNNDSFGSWEDSQDDGSGRTRVDFLAEEDMTVLRPLIFVELSALMDKSGQRVGKVKPAKRKRKEDGTLFGLSLATLLEKDSHIMVETHSVPLVFQKVLGELEKRGIQEEGILRVAGNKQRVESLCAKLDHEFYTRPEVADHLIASAHVHELSTLLKRLIRLMPQPLLTSHLLHLFYQSQGVPDCLQALNLLVLLLPTEHRATLYALLTFLANVVANQQSNKMSAHNVAMIMAPSFFPPNVLVAKSGLKAELGLAVQCCRLMEAMMDAGERLWLVPNQLIRQLRIINTGGRKENNDIGGGAAVVRIDAPQFLLNSVPIALDKYSTVGDVIIRIVDMARDVPRICKSAVVGNRRDIKSRALSELAPNGNLSCLLSTGDPDTALRTHFLYEVGGNIGQRRLEPTARLSAIHKNNPNGRLVIRCDHRNGSHRILKRI